MDNTRLEENAMGENRRNFDEHQEKHQSYPKTSYGLVNHWGAMVDHVSNYDKQMCTIEKVSRSLDASQLEKTLHGQIKDKTQRHLEARLKEKEFELKLINESLTKYRNEEKDRRNYKDKVKNLQSDSYDTQIKTKQDSVRVRNNLFPNGKNTLNSNRKIEPMHNQNNVKNERELNNSYQNTPNKYSRKSNSIDYGMPTVPAKKRPNGICNTSTPLGNLDNGFYEEISKNNLNSRHARYKRDNYRLGNLDNRLSKSFDIKELTHNNDKSPGNSPLGTMFNQHYNSVHRRNETYKSYAKNLLEDIETNRVNRKSIYSTTMNTDKYERTAKETEYQTWLRDHREKKSQKSLRYKKDLDNQVQQDNQKKTFKLKMTKNEKLINRNNLDAFKSNDPNLFSAVPGWGNNAKFIPNHNLFQKQNKRESKI